MRRLIVGNGRAEREIPLVGTLVIGRDPACHVSDPDPLLSRRHAEIVANVHGVSVRDLDSRNGLLVNGEKTREQVLRPGDVVQLGHLQLQYLEDQPSVGTPPSDRCAPEPAPGTAARLVTDADLTVTEASPQCADLLGVPGERLVGDSLPEVFLRGVRRAYADPSVALSMTVAQGPRGSVTVTFTLDRNPAAT